MRRQLATFSAFSDIIISCVISGVREYERYRVIEGEFRDSYCPVKCGNRLKRQLPSVCSDT